MNTSTKMIGVGAALVVTLTGCGLKEGIDENANGHVKTVGYDSGADGKKNQDARLPGWVPDQAKGVTEVIRTTGSERLLKFTTAALPPTCVLGAPTKTAATLTADWWPHGAETRTDRICEDWHVFAADGAVFAYKPETIEQKL
ncbi:hypothetical protein [Amycolatopsis sp. WQ 127309]|uniref:hypothetical protein n=1 Tax=Amycolatopsis sp. WQ 127309 TaxID=2932773 RepID=UPI001FF4E419|nr:hypothetical protein [Amycolatopsis sp. WQ 127309]UOZ09921.1 hypothetical protein MUY22_17270 [Amycolatopsis sp. WQ 127309]